MVIFSLLEFGAVVQALKTSEVVMMNTMKVKKRDFILFLLLLISE